MKVEHLAIDFKWESEPGLKLGSHFGWYRSKRPLVVLVTCDGAMKAAKSDLADKVRDTEFGMVTIDLRATGPHALATERVGRAVDHHSAEWALWIGRPLLGQWVFDVRRYLDCVIADAGQNAPSEIIVIGEGPAGLVALCATATDKRITKAAAVGTLASYVTEEPYTGQRLATMAPGILRDVGDVAHIAALAAPKRVVIAGGVGGNGKPLTPEQLREAYRPASRVWELVKAPKGLAILDTTDAAAVIAALK
jgi:hypothetical protein